MKRFLKGSVLVALGMATAFGGTAVKASTADAAAAETLIARDQPNQCNRWMRATTLRPNRIVNKFADVSRPGDVDFFKVRVPRNGILEVWTTGDTDTMGKLFRRCTQELAANDDQASGDLNFRIRERVRAGTHRIQVRGYGWSTGSYDLHFRFRPISDEQGDTCWNAADAEIGTPEEARINRSGDRDVFRFDVNGGETIFTTGSTDTYGRLLDENCMEIDRNDDTNDLNMSLEVPDYGSPTTVFVEVSHYSPNGRGDYVLESEAAPTNGCYWQPEPFNRRARFDNFDQYISWPGEHLYISRVKVLEFSGAGLFPDAIRVDNGREIGLNSFPECPGYPQSAGYDREGNPLTMRCFDVGDFMNLEAAVCKYQQPYNSRHWSCVAQPTWENNIWVEGYTYTAVCP